MPRPVCPAGQASGHIPPTSVADACVSLGPNRPSSVVAARSSHLRLTTVRMQHPTSSRRHVPPPIAPAANPSTDIIRPLFLRIHAPSSQAAPATRNPQHAPAALPVPVTRPTPIAGLGHGPSIPESHVCAPSPAPHRLLSRCPDNTKRPARPSLAPPRHFPRADVCTRSACTGTTRRRHRCCALACSRRPR